MLFRVLRWVPAVVWMGVIFYLSSQPGLPIDAEPDADLLHLEAHVITYASLALFLALGLGTSRRGLFMALVITMVYSALDEVHQLLVPGREGRVREVLVDTASAACVLATFAGLRSLICRSRRGVGAMASVSGNRGWRE